MQTLLEEWSEDKESDEPQLVAQSENPLLAQLKILNLNLKGIEVPMNKDR